MRDAVHDVARYLKGVRPIDPVELTAYVEGDPDPERIRRHLRDLAVDLAVVERADGTFVPVADDPVQPSFTGVEALPEAYDTHLAERLRSVYGPDWSDGRTGDRLRSVIGGLKADYFAGEDVVYDQDTALGYAVYHLADYYAAIQYVLADLAATRLLPRRLRVLDVGAGVGGPALGLNDLLFGPPDIADPDPPPAVVGYDAIEPSAAADVLEELLGHTARNFRTQVHRTTAEAFVPETTYDLVIYANVLSELDDPVGVVGRYLDALAPHGSVVMLAPADRNTAIGLRVVAREVEAQTGATIYSPEVRLWPNHTPDDRGWGFDIQPDLEPPEIQTRLDRGDRSGSDNSRPKSSEPGAGAFVNVDVQYAFAVLRLDGTAAIEFRPDASRAAKLAEIDRHVTDRIDLYAIKLSHDLGGTNPIFRVGDGSQTIDHFAVRTDPSPLTQALPDAAYGDLLRFENTLVLWNDDEAAYNLVVDDAAIVDHVESRPRSTGSR